MNGKSKKKDLKPIAKPEQDPMNEQTVRWFTELDGILSPFWSARLGQ